MSDNGACDPVDPQVCANYRTDPVHVGSGAYLTNPYVDVRFEGANVPIEFVRIYSSMDAWAWPGKRAREYARLAQGWFNTYDESLYASSVDMPPDLPGAAGSTYVHRTAHGNGRRFVCAAAPGSGGLCRTSDGSLDVLRYDSTGAFWEIIGGNGVRARFSASGELVSRGWFNTGGALVDGWTVTRYTSGSFAGRVNYVQDHWGRRLYFDWTVNAWGTAILTGLHDAAMVTLATFARHSEQMFILQSAASAAGNETYVYRQLSGTSNLVTSHLISILRNGDTVASITYDDPPNRIGLGRVVTVQTGDGHYALRHRGAPNNTCPSPSASTMVIDRSTNLGIACDPGAPNPDAPCAASGEAIAVCDEGTCRAATCQEYAAISGGVAISQPIRITGNCPCGGSDELVWTAPNPSCPEAPPRIARSIARDGKRTTYAYDCQGRVTASCEGDDDDTVTTTASSCPTTGVWESFEYDTTWPSLRRLERRRSRLSAGAIAETETVYDTALPVPRFIKERGYTRDLADALVGPVEQVTELLYDASGRITERLGPADERTVYEYWPTGSGLSTGMLQAERRYASTSTYIWAAYYASHSTLGRPGQVLDASAIVTTYTYSYGGMRLDQVNRAGILHTFTYDAGGRLWRVVGGGGIALQFNYDTQGRNHRIVRFDDTSFTGKRDRISITYDSAGRRTAITAERHDGTAVIDTPATWTATYETHGYRASETPGNQGAASYTYDEAAMGYLEGLTRGDGDVETFENDDFGRNTQITRTFAPGVTGTHTLGYVNVAGSNTNTGDGFPTRVTDPLNTVRTYVYDDFGHRVRSESTHWGIERWRWISDRMTEAKHADGERSVYTYDRMGRVTAIDHDADHPTLLGQDYAFAYDNGDDAISCPTVRYECANRLGRLARVSIEHTPGMFWQMYYDYAADGQLGTERWPDGRETNYTYSSGRLRRMYMPAFPLDAVRYDYGVLGDNDYHDGTEVVRMVHERNGPELINWASNIQRDALGRLRTLSTHDAPSVVANVQWGTDGRIECMWAFRRTGPTTSTRVVDRCYDYRADGSVSGHDALAAGDSPRTFFYDGGNRLVCATSASGSASCPTGSPLLESYTYDPDDSRRTRRYAGADTTYDYVGGALSVESPPPGRTITYSYNLGSGGQRATDVETTAGSPSNTRSYVYDGDGRVSVLTLPRPTGSPSTTRENHTITTLYDHRARPLMVVDHNDATGVEARHQYYYDREDRLINWVHTPNTATPNDYSVGTYVPIEPLLTGSIGTNFVNGAPSSELYGYYVMAPEGLPAAAYSFDRTTLATSEVWRAQYSPFGTVLSETGTPSDWRPPFRFPGQLQLPRSEASWWNGSTLFTSRERLALNRWRLYDPRVGQYLQPEPMLVSGGLARPNPYAYALLAPYDYVDPDGNLTISLPVLLGGTASGAGGYIFIGTVVAVAITATVLEVLAWKWVIDHAIDYGREWWERSHSGETVCQSRGDADEESDEDRQRRCREVKNGAIESCSETHLPTGDYGFRFWNCINDIMRDAGCL